MILAQVEQEILSLSESDRIHLLEVLWNSLASAEDHRKLELWAEEGERRVDAVNAGKLSLVDAEQVFRDLRGRLDS